MLKKVTALMLAAVFAGVFACSCMAAESLISVVPNGVDTYDIVITQESKPATMLNIALSCTPTDDPIITMPGGWGVVGGVNFVKRSDAVILVMAMVS